VFDGVEESVYAALELDQCVAEPVENRRHRLILFGDASALAAVTPGLLA
jgi:hypothetical protein